MMSYLADVIRRPSPYLYAEVDWCPALLSKGARLLFLLLQGPWPLLAMELCAVCLAAAAFKNDLLDFGAPDWVPDTARCAVALE